MKCNCESHNDKKRLSLGDFIKWAGGTAQFSDRMKKTTLGSVVNDSRMVQQGDVFVALKTEKDDGHKYVKTALEAGASAALIETKQLKLFSAADQKKCICVSNPLKAVSKAAAAYRKELGILFIGVTGSSGKTTTRSFVSSVLKRKVTVGETWGNWNNHIGVPLSILKFNGDEYAGVIEMGANHGGEIHELSMIARPDISIITNIGYAHVGLFGSLADTTNAKFEIADGLNKKDGFMLLNGDDPRLVKGAKVRALPAVFYGYGKNCGVRVQNVIYDRENGITFEVLGTQYKLNLPGRHFIYSALPAIFMGLKCGVPEKQIYEVIAEQKPVSMRGTVEIKNGVGFIVDCYNANPSSMKSALDYLCDYAQKENRCAVIGDMLELGSYSRRLHKQLGEQIAAAEIGKLITVGNFANVIADAARSSGFKKENILICQNSDAAADVAGKFFKPGEVV
ncbi:MAG TPA: UDP-N-acetylmuramoyl-tripeptide--D-alanyl-D-alanine ligase, partial [Chitinispirillaceae bacterium]|nr:UDP-N-acetylmuramoyl-tripeptide--D-alanyl-D-alanine ligase [Chitinispirillaceae bacterium]